MGRDRSPDEKNDESKLIEKAKAGRREAFEALMNKYRKEIYGLSYRILGNHHDADDIAQKTFIKAFFSLKKFKGKSSFKTWIYAIAMNTAKSFLAQRKKQKKIELPLLEDVASGQMEHQKMEKELSTKSIIARALKSMPERQKEVLILKFFHGMKHVEIARALGITPGAAKANLFHAIKFLKSRIENRMEKEVT